MLNIIQYSLPVTVSGLVLKCVFIGAEIAPLAS